MKPEELKIGMEVLYFRHMGNSAELIKTKVKSEPWQLGHGEWVVQLEGYSGGFSLRHLKPVK